MIVNLVGFAENKLELNIVKVLPERRSFIFVKVVRFSLYYVLF